MNPADPSPSLPPQQPQDASDEPASDQPAPVRSDRGIARKLKLIAHLMSSLDMLIFAELCALYYMDCSIIHFTMRSTIQYLFFTPKPETFVVMPAHLIHIFAILVPNGLCLLSHLFLALPQPVPSSRGYLHGGIIVDFVGQKAPLSRIPLVLLDLLVVLVQFVLLVIQMERDGIRNTVANPANPPTQDDAAPAEHNSEEENRLLEEGQASPPRQPPATTDPHIPHLDDSLRSGCSLLADIDVVSSLKRAYDATYDGPVTQSFTNMRYSRILGARAAEQRRLQQAAGPGQQQTS